MRRLERRTSFHNITDQPVDVVFGVAPTYLEVN